MLIFFGKSAQFKVANLSRGQGGVNGYLSPENAKP
jgi:hypothetical protein